MLVYVSQIFAYMAVAIAPVTITAPIIGLSNIFRLYLARVLNPHHEMFGSDVIFATSFLFWASWYYGKPGFAAVAGSGSRSWAGSGRSGGD